MTIIARDMPRPTQSLTVPGWLADAAEPLGELAPRHHGTPLAREDIRQALTHPVWPGGNGPPVCDLVSPGESVCLVVSDYTRKTATDAVLPVLLEGLTARGCDPRDMQVLIACGTHRPTTGEEAAAILGPEATRALAGRIFCHDADADAELRVVGETRSGHRVRLNRRAVEADRLLLIGAATYHYHAGFGGGRKSLVPGVAALDTIAYNHSLTLDPAADRLHPGVGIGVLDGNPVAEEMIEAALLNPPDAILNTVLDPEGCLVGLFCGDMDAAHRCACRHVELVCRAAAPRKADFVIASAGAAPNWVQSHKALFNAFRAIRAGGRVILVAPCPEGLGSERFRHWIRKPHPAALFEDLRRSPEVLGQAALSTMQKREQTVLVTGLCTTDSQDLGMPTAPDLETALRQVLRDLGEGERKPGYYLHSRARYVVPF